MIHAPSLIALGQARSVTVRVSLFAPLFVSRLGPFLDVAWPSPLDGQGPDAGRHAGE